MAKSERRTSIYREGDSTGSRERRVYRRTSDRSSIIRTALAEHGLKVSAR